MSDNSNDVDWNEADPSVGGGVPNTPGFGAFLVVIGIVLAVSLLENFVPAFDDFMDRIRNAILDII